MASITSFLPPYDKQTSLLIKGICCGMTGISQQSEQNAHQRMNGGAEVFEHARNRVKTMGSTLAWPVPRNSRDTCPASKKHKTVENSSDSGDRFRWFTSRGGLAASIGQYTKDRLLIR